MRTYAWFATTLVVVTGTSACSTSTRTKFAATAAAVARAADAAPLPPVTSRPSARVVASPVVAMPRPIALGETPPSDPAAIGSPDAEPLRVVGEVPVPSRPCNATCPVMVGMPVDPACTTVWHGCRIAFCDVDARSRWESSPTTFASNLPPTLSETPVRAPFPGAQLVAAPAPAAATAAKATAAPTVVAPVATVPLAPSRPKVAPSAPPAAPIDLFGEEDCDDECKDGSCRLPLPPR